MNAKTDSAIFKTVYDGIKADNALIPSKIANFQLRQGLKEGTQILLANGMSKNIEDIKYGDIIQSWNFVDKTFISVKSYGVIAIDYTDQWKRYILTNGQFLDVNTDTYIYSSSKGYPILLSTWEPQFKAFTITNEREKIKHPACYGDIVFSRSYILLSENSFYFANGILCGHMPQDLYKYAMLGKLTETTEEEKIYFYSLAQYWKKNEMIYIGNPNYLLANSNTSFQYEQYSDLIKDYDQQLTQFLSEEEQKTLRLKKANIRGQRTVQGKCIKLTQHFFSIQKKPVLQIFRELHVQQIAYIKANKES